MFTPSVIIAAADVSAQTRFIVAVIYCVIKKNIRNGAMLAIRFILFAILPSIPWFIYFLATGSLDDWFRCYIYDCFCINQN